MKEIILDGRMLGNPEIAHPYLKEQLELPDYYGNNLDAFYDCLTDLDEVRIKINQAEQETDFFRRLRKVFEMAEKNGEIKLEIASFH